MLDECVDECPAQEWVFKVTMNLLEMSEAAWNADRIVVVGSIEVRNHAFLVLYHVIETQQWSQMFYQDSTQWFLVSDPWTQPENMINRSE